MGWLPPSHTIRIRPVARTSTINYTYTHTTEANNTVDLHTLRVLHELQHRAELLARELGRWGDARGRVRVLGVLCRLRRARAPWRLVPRVVLTAAPIVVVRLVLVVVLLLLVVVAAPAARVAPVAVLVL